MQAIHTGVLVYGSEYWYGAGLNFVSHHSLHQLQSRWASGVEKLL